MPDLIKIHARKVDCVTLVPAPRSALRARPIGQARQRQVKAMPISWANAWPRVLRSVAVATAAPTRKWQARCSESGRRLIVMSIALLAWSTLPVSADSTALKHDATIPFSQQIVGTWQLASIYEEDSGGEDIDQFGIAPKGQLIVDGRGHFSLQIMSQGGRRYSSRDRPAPVHVNALVEAMSYFGAYYLDPHHNKLILHASHCLFRSCDKTNRSASVKIRGNEMELVSAVELSLTGAHYSRTVWRRVCCD